MIFATKKKILDQIKDLNSQDIVNKIAGNLKNVFTLEEIPSWVYQVKTSSGKARLPVSKEYVYERGASILYKLLKEEFPIGIRSFATLFQSKKRRGTRREHSVKAGRSIITELVNLLSNKEYLIVIEKKGRALTLKGLHFIEKCIQ